MKHCFEPAGADAACKGGDESQRDYDEQPRRSAKVALTGIDKLVRLKALWSQPNSKQLAEFIGTIFGEGN